MDDCVYTWEDTFSWKKHSHYGCVTNLEEAISVINEYEYDTCSSFSETRSTKNFGEFDMSVNHFIRFTDDTTVEQGSPIPSDGEAFVITGMRLLECHQGPDHRKLTKEAQKGSSDGHQDHTYKQRASKRKITGTKKLGCSASICLREVIMFPEYKPAKDTHYYRDACSLKLRRDLQSSNYEEITMKKLIFIDLPKAEQHSGHIMGDAADLKAPIDERVNLHIRKLVCEGISNTSEIQRNVKLFVKSLFGSKLPQNLNRRFYPSREDIRKIVYREQKRLMEGKLDQERLREKVLEWTEESSENVVYYRPSSIEEEGESGGDRSSFMFLFQSEWQRRLLAKYGNELVFLDATYRTTRYALPLFFLCVHTNCGYFIVASIIIENEDSASLAEAFEKLKEVNVNFSPRAFMIDSSEIEMNAIKMSFPEANTFICDFHRKQAWVRWTNTTRNGVTDCKEKVLSMLNDLAEAVTEDEFQERLSGLRESEIWKKNERLRNYMERQWLPKYQSWVWAYRGSWLTLVINTNNGVEAQNKVFKYDYLASYKDSTVTRLMQCLIEEYFVDLYRKYLIANITMSSGWRTPADHVPVDLQHKPLHLVQHMKEVEIKAASVPAEAITRLDEISFLVMSGSVIYPVCLGNETTMPSCECRPFRRTHLPCKHFGAIFRHYDDISFSSLPEIYTGNPIFNLDHDLFNKMDVPGFVKEENICHTHRDDTGETAQQVVEHELPTETQTSTPMSRLDISAKRVREALSTIHGLSFLVNSEECLNNAKTDLDKMISSMKTFCPESGGLILEQPKEKKKSKTVLADLPKRKRRKQRGPVKTESSHSLDGAQENQSDDIQTKADRGTKRAKLSLSAKAKKKQKLYEKNEDPPKQETTKATKTVTWQDTVTDNNDNYADIDSQKARNEAEKIWAWPGGSDYITAKVYKFNVTDNDIRSLDHGEWLTDQIIDAYLAHLTQAEFDKGKKIKHEPSSTMTSIINGEHTPKNRKYRVYEYDMIIGAYLQGGHHWDLVVIEPKKKILYFFNSMGETVFQQRRVLQNWKNFLGRTLNDNKNWKLEVPVHTKQTDSFNCGIYTLMFAESHLLERPCMFKQEEVLLKRKEVAATLLLYEVNVQNCCPCCGLQLEGEEQRILCGMCQRYFHKKPHCVGDILAEGDSDSFICQRCQYNVT